MIKNERKMKEIENSNLLIQVIDEESRDQFGRRILKTHWEKINYPLELGSIKKPLNTKVLRFKIEVKDDEEENPFDVLRKMFKP